MAQFREVIESKGGFVEVFFEEAKKMKKPSRKQLGPLQMLSTRILRGAGQMLLHGKEGARKPSLLRLTKELEI